MARPTTIKGSKFLILVHDGATPGVFVSPCALATKGINFSAEPNEFNVPDCDDPDAPTWTERVIATLSAAVEGSGTLAMESLDLWWTWFTSAAERQVKVKVDAPVGEGGGEWAMEAVLTTFNVGADVGGLATVELAIQSHGAVVWTDAV